MASTRQVQQPSSAPIVAAAAVALAGAFAWKGWPFALPLWLGLAVWGWTEPPVLLTGRKDASGMATPAGPGEQKALRRWAAAGQLKWRPVTPNADWLPGWPPRASWFAALIAAAVAWSAPVVTEKLRWVNAAAAYLATMSAVGVRRRTMVDDDVCPGAKLDTLAETIRSAPQLAVGAVVAAGAAGWAAATFAPKWDPWAVGPGGPDTVAYQSPEALAGLASFGVRHPAVLTVACAAAGALAVVAVPWVNRALEHWRIVVAGRAEWNPRWLSLKFDPPPFLVDRQQVGSATVDTFFAPSAQGSVAFYQLRAKVEPTVGAGTKVAILETPNESPEGPVPGTLHPLRFEVVSWPTEQLPDPGDPSTPPEVAALWARCAFDWAHDTLGYGRPVLLGVEALHTPDSPTAAWTSSWAWPGGPGLTVVREQTLGDVGGQLGCDALIDHRSDELFFGVLDPDAETDFAADTNPPYAVRFERLALEDTWTFRWGEALKQATHAPVVEHSTTAEAKLADGTVIYRQVFVTRLGIDPREFATAGQERKIATALQAAPFVTVRGFPLAGQRRGERHPQAVAVFWSKAPIPNSPQLLAPVPRGGPNNATEWVLGGLMNDAFDHGRLSRPEVTDAVCLTQPDARAHLWRITVRLHDGVTLSDVRGAAARIRQSLGVEWLRVTPVTDGAMLFCGVRPEVAKLASERRDRQVLIALDWEQAFLDAGVTGQNGLLPQLVASSTLPANEQVQVLDFTLPPGLSATQVSAAIPKLSTATNNTFVELRPGPNAQTVRLLASVDNPLPAKVGFDFDAVDASEMIPFATGVEGTPVEFDQTSSPHVLIAGMTGAGKSQPLDSRVPVPVSDRFPDGWATIGELEIGDPVFAADGTPTPILGFSDIVEQPVHTLHFDTGESVDCGPEHLWKVSTAASRRVRTPNVNRARDERFQTLMARSARLRELAERAQAGLLASRPDLAALSGLSLTTVHRLLPETLAVKVDVPHGRKVDQVCIDDLVPRLEEIVEARGSVKIIGSAVGRPQLATLPAGGWLTIREIAETILGRSSTRNERDRVKDLVRRSGAARRPGGQATETLTGFPVDEALILLAEHFEHMAVRSDSGRQVRPLEEIVTAAEIAAAVTEASGRRNFAVRLPAAIGGPEADLPVDPYVLGAWLGDGNKRNGEITQSVDETCVDETARESDNAWLLAEIVRLGYDAHRKRSDDQVISVLNLRVPLREIGVLCNKHIPATYLRASAAQRLALLQGLMDTDGTIDARGSCELSLCDGRLAADALELVRSLGIKASITDAPASITEDDPERPGERRRRVTGTRWRIHFTTTTEVFRLPRKAARVPDGTRSTQGWRYVTGVTVGDPVPMRCISVDHPEHLYLTEGFVPTHNSVLAQAFLYGAVIRGWDCYLVDPVKGGADFIFAKDRCKAFAQTPFEAAGVMRSIYAEVAARKNLNAKHGAGSIDELPADIRPPRIFLFIDEFTSLMGQALVPKTDDPEMQDEIEALEAENRARNEIGMFVGKIAREARSAGVHLALGTQKLTAKMLDSIPGAGNDLKDLALETRVPVPASDRFPDGWATVGELEVGDLLFAPDGTLTPIIGFSPVRTNSHVYDVTFDDGQTVRAGASHLWTVSTYQSRRAPRRRSAEPPTRKMRWAERMDEIAASTPVGTWATAADLAALISCSKPAVLSWAKTLGIDAMFQAEDGSLHALPRDRRSGHATRVFSVRHAAELLAEPGIDRLRLLDTEWMSARQIATVLDDAPPSRQRASSVGTLLAKHSVESRPGHPNERPADSKKTPRMFLRSDAADKLAAAQPYGDLSRLADYHDQWLPASEIRSLLLGRRATPSEVASMRGALGELGCLSKDPADLAPMFDVVELCRSAAVAFREGAHLDEDGQIAPSRFVQTTEEMFEALSTSGSRSTFAVDLASPVASPAADLPVDPYVLGVWLGDGCKGSGNVVSGNGAGCVDDLGRSDQEHMVRELSDAGYSGHKLACSDILIGTYGLRAKLREMGLLHDKHIPSMYLRASFDQRLALLQGLMDTDGTVSKRGVPSFDQSSLRVVEGFIELAQSLGIKTMVSSWPTRRPDGSLTGSVNYHVTVRSTLPLFRLPRKAERLARLPRTPRAVEYRAIRSITPAPPTKTRCIAVEHDDHLFLVEGFIPTHNTNLARTLLGKASYGDRASALRAPDDAPKLEGDIPKGRGLWEPLSSAAMVVQCWFAPQSELREALVSRVPALDPSLVLDLSQFAPAEREETTGPPPLRPPSSGGRPAPARVPEAAEVVDVDEMELSLDDLDTDDDAELETAEELAGIEITWGAPDDADAAGDGPVQEADDDELVWDLPVVEDLEVLDRPDTPPHLADTVAFIDIDGVVFPMGRPGSEWEDWTPSVRDDENGWVSPTMLSGIRTLDARLAWLTGWGERAEAFAPELGDLPVVEVPGAVEHGWWKIDGALAWLRDHPEVTRVVWFDDELDNDNDGGRSHREVFAELLDGLGIEHLLVCTSSFVGLLPSELAAATRWVERSSGSPTPQPAVDATIDLGDPGWLTEEPAPAPEPVEEDDPFAAPPPPRLADDEDDDDEFAPPPPLRPADTSDEFA